MDATSSGYPTRLRSVHACTPSDASPLHSHLTFRFERRAAAALACVLVLVGCTRESTPAPSAAAPAANDAQPVKTPELGLQDLPATYTGDFPCADCEALRYHLDVFDDGTYFLRTIYVGRSEDGIDDFGEWTIGGYGHTLDLRGYRTKLKRFLITDETTLRKLNLAGDPIRPGVNYDLKRGATFAPIEPAVGLRGLYSYEAAAGIFTECRTGKRLRVAPEGDNAALESAYAGTNSADGANALAKLRGRIVMRAPMEGQSPRATLIVDRFESLDAGIGCHPTASNASLENTSWRLTRIGDTPASVVDGEREPHLVLNSFEKRVFGSGGCNRFTGTYSVDGERLTFRPIASTRMACAQGMEQEQAFFGVLSGVARWRLAGQHLEFLDEHQRSLAEFEFGAVQ